MAATLIAPPGVLPAARGRPVRSRRAAVLATAGNRGYWPRALFLMFGRLTPITAPGTFPHDPELKRAHTLLYAVSSTPADFALADDIVKPLLAARPNDPEVVTVGGRG